MGNVLIAMPLALIISIVWLQVKGTPMIGIEQAEHLLHDLDPFHSVALFHAAIAGVFLFLSGLIAGYYDNLALFNNIGERIARHKLLLRFVSESWLQRFGTFVENNLGAIMGNFLFGVFLGSTATIGFIFGMPLDIRHIAFASANFSHGIFNMAADDFGLGVVLISLLGVALIGTLNLLVSFSLAIIVALRSKGVEVIEWKTISKLMYTHLLTQPRDFFLPRPEPMKYAKIDSQGYMIYEEANKTQKHKLFPKHFAVRRLSSIRVVPEGVAIDTSHTDEVNEKKELQDKLATDQPTTPTEKKIVKLDDQEFELVNPELLETGIVHTDTGAGSSNDKTKNAKTPLPKPKNPPKLPE